MIQHDPYNAIKPLVRFHENGKEFSNSFAEGVHAFGTLLTRPASWWLDGAVRVFVLDLKPGWQNQCDTPFKECAYRAALCIVGLVTLPFALLMGMIGAPLRALASQFKADFIVTQPKQSIESKKESPTILSFNVMLMPEFITQRNKCRPTMERVHEIAQSLVKANDDVICLQEVFHTGAAKVLEEALTQAGYHVIRNIGDQVLGLNSGLLMASKKKFENIKFYPHPLKDGADDLANKGTLLATTTIGNRKVLVTNYHANGGGDKIPGFVCRYVQQEAATAHIERYVAESKEKFAGVFFIGDMNMAPTETGERNKETQELEPVLDLEWELADRMHKWKSEQGNWTDNLPSQKNMTSKEEWIKSEYFKAIQSSYYRGDSIRFNNNESLDDNLVRVCTQNLGGPVPSKLYTHDLHKSGMLTKIEKDSDWIKRAKAGSNVDLDQHQDVGFKPGVVKTAPRRLDFIAVRKKEQNARLKTVTIDSMLVSGKPHSSDHHAVRAEVVL